MTISRFLKLRPLRQIAFGLVALAVVNTHHQASAEEPPAFRNARGQFILLKPARIPAPVQFFTESGRAVTLRDFRGKVVLLNFWATWCLPCRIEMPSLDRLQADLGGKSFEVVAVSIDREGLLKVKPFFEAVGLQHLSIYLDPKRRLGFLGGKRPAKGSFALYAFPITYIIDHKGRVAGYFPGPAEWDSPAAKRLMRFYLKRRHR